MRHNTRGREKKLHEVSVVSRYRGRVGVKEGK